ncbi:FAD-dependent oxidoreductase [Thalassotalea sp. 1_MG-2023]|uniref:NAD(P)/FAD-dependent oxidoreductase n=1 Tax=Thalassotalea sp. 1_MG-2023 TaxID=3062680 RepID=UPI0026E48A90|nr:FAD-dependent oxidoreductase [Thalassotalea sp. 1_MG-2023]MDO6427893.1 FAD-dependent oxidoreductase [Thalassotalea sp. 1_MG-2023]
MKHIAVIGAGISGLTAAHVLSKKHHVSVFESQSNIGGHTATVDVEVDGRSYAIDTGFIVFNNKTYPNFLALLASIGVDKQATEMSFSVHNCQTGLEYNGHTLATLFAQKRNLLNPKFWRLILDILRFNKLCKAVYQKQSILAHETLGSFLQQNGFNKYFSEHYILPMGAAIWSSSLAQMEQFQLRFFIQFFYNHGLLNVTNRPQWYVIPKGSRNYLTPLIAPFKNNISVDAQIRSVQRRDNSVTLVFQDQSEKVFDDVVFACHSDQALSLLDAPKPKETEILSAMPYAANSVVLHTDDTLLPVRKKAWASWNYQLSDNRTKPASVTYNMNILQGLDTEHTFCVTLNQKEAIAPEKILREFTYYHPVFSVQSLAAQQRRSEVCGVGNTHFCGAYWYNGFHEDGVRSALDVAARFDCFLAKDHQ